MQERAAAVEAEGRWVVVSPDGEGRLPVGSPPHPGINSWKAAASGLRSEAILILD